MLLLDVVQTLQSDAIPFVVIGPWAEALHGEPCLPGPVDIAIPHTRRDFIRLEKSLCSLALESTLPMGAGQVFNFRKELIRNKHLEFWEFLLVSQPRLRVRVSLTQETPSEILARLEIQEAFRTHCPPASRSKLISIKIPEILLENFRRKAKLRRTPYQTQIKLLMMDWLTKS